MDAQRVSSAIANLRKSELDRIKVALTVGTLVPKEESRRVVVEIGGLVESTFNHPDFYQALEACAGDRDALENLMDERIQGLIESINEKAATLE